jgi:hypothetical protein
MMLFQAALGFESPWRGGRLRILASGAEADAADRFREWGYLLLSGLRAGRLQPPT